MNIELSHINSIYFLGIGGIGMSALARYFVQKGKKVSGYDRTSTPLTHQLEGIGIDITYVDAVTQGLESYDLVIYTPAIPKDSVIMQYIVSKNMLLMKRSEVLGMISRADRTIAIAGTHGKTTTTAIITHLLFQNGIQVTGFVGGMMANYNANYLNSGTDYIVVEADEYDRSFLTLEPYISAVLSMDADHLDIYGDNESVLDGFKAFINKTHAGGTVLIHNSLRSNFNADEWQRLNEQYQILLFGAHANDVYVDNVVNEDDGTVRFDYHYKTMLYKNVRFTMQGLHNISNASVAITIALLAGVKFDNIRVALEAFKGIKRRFEYILENNSVVFIDDYAHHPSELANAIATAKSRYPGKKIMGIFQPHLFTRTRDFVEGFAQELDKLDIPILTDIYPARELPIEGVTSEIILDKMHNPLKQYVPFRKIVEFVKAQKPEVLLTLGAGDIDTLIEPLKSELQ